MSGVSLGVSGHRGRVMASDQSDTDNSDLEADLRHRSSPYKDSGYRWVGSSSIITLDNIIMELFLSVILMDLWTRRRSIEMNSCPPWPLTIARF